MQRRLKVKHQPMGSIISCVLNIQIGTEHCAIPKENPQRCCNGERCSSCCKGGSLNPFMVGQETSERGRRGTIHNRGTGRGFESRIEFSTTSGHDESNCKSHY